jgi:hypothetical protein
MRGRGEHGMMMKEDESERELVMRYASRFGDIAIKKGFISKEQVEAALTEQVLCNSFVGCRQPKLLGEILFENGWITLRQIEIVLEDLSAHK